MTDQETIARLSSNDLADYEANGFLVKPGLFPAEELAGLDDEIERLLPEYEDRAGHRQGWMFGTPSELTVAVAQDHRVLDLIEPIVHPGIAIHSVKLVAKLPRSDDVCHWHQDEAFYRKPDDPSTFSQTRMSVWIPLQDSDERNGCLWVVPGSHRWGLEPYEMVDHGTCRRKINREQYASEHAVPVPVPAGSAVLFSGWTWHHSGSNATDRVRRAFIVSYQEATLHGGTHPEWRIARSATQA